MNIKEYVVYGIFLLSMYCFHKFILINEYVYDLYEANVVTLVAFFIAYFIIILKDWFSEDIDEEYAIENTLNYSKIRKMFYVTFLVIIFGFIMLWWVNFYWFEWKLYDVTVIFVKSIFAAFITLLIHVSILDAKEKID